MRQIFYPFIAGLLLLGACSSDPEATPASGPAAGSYTGGPGAGGTGGRGGRDVTSTAVGQPRPGSQEDLAQNVGDRVLFETDRYDLAPDARRQVEGWAGWLRRYPSVSVVVEGHADERGTREYNLALGERRATTVRDYLVAQGIPSGRMRTISYGKERPAVLGSNESGWAQNRRAMLVVQ